MALACLALDLLFLLIYSICLCCRRNKNEESPNADCCCTAWCVIIATLVCRWVWTRERTGGDSVPSVSVTKHNYWMCPYCVTHTHESKHPKITAWEYQHEFYYSPISGVWIRQHTCTCSELRYRVNVAEAASVVYRILIMKELLVPLSSVLLTRTRLIWISLTHRRVLAVKTVNNRNFSARLWWGVGVRSS